MSDFIVRYWKRLSITDLLSFFILICFILSKIVPVYTNKFFYLTNPFSYSSSLINFLVPTTYLLIGLLAIRYRPFTNLAPILLLFPLIEILVDLPIAFYWAKEIDKITIGLISKLVFIILISLLLWDLLKRKPLKIEVSIQSIIFALLTTSFALLYWIGRWLPWMKRNTLIRAEGFTWNENGGKLRVESFNQLADTLTNAWGIAEILGALSAIFFITLIAILKEKTLRSLLILILGSKSILLPLSYLLSPFETSPSQKILGYTQEQLDEFQLVVTQSRGIGIWVCFLTSILLLLTALFSAFFSQVKAPVRKKN